jgi:hypothetical protein
MNPNYTQTIKEELDKLLDARFIILVENSEWVLPITITIKKNGKLQVCVEYYKLNDCINKDYYPLPFIDDILDEVIGNELYSFGDGYSGYNHIQIAKEDNLKTTFTTPWGTFAYMVMPFGLCNALEIFQRFMNKVLGPYIGLFVQVFLDDFCVYGNQEMHLHNLKQVFDQLVMANVFLNLKNYCVGCTKIIMLGHIVSEDGIRTYPINIEKVIFFPFPKTKR